MIKKKSFTLQAPDKKVGGWARFQEWNQKWNKIMSTVFGVLIFALLFAIVMVNTTNSTNQEKSGNIMRKLNITVAITCKFFPVNNTGGDKCDVECFKTLPENLVDEFETAVADDDGECLTIGYHLRYIEPQVLKISRGWFHTTRFIRKITLLDVNTSQRKITDIEPGAFDDCTFRRMTELLIRWTGVQVVKRGIFDGANNLKILRLHENVFLQHIEEYALEPLHRLEEVHLTGHQQFGNVFNFTGTNQYNHLRTLILTFNNFGTSINAETFKGCTRIETLNLSNSFIQSIGAGTFDHMAETIRFLDLSNNQLKHLPSNLLDIRSDIQIRLSNNSLACDCDSAESLTWYISNSHLIIDGPLLCDMPPAESGKAITDVDFSKCASNFTSTTLIPEHTTKSTDLTMSTTMQPPMLEQLECINKTYAIDGTLYLEKIYQYFKVTQLEMGKVSVEITSPNPTLSMVIINDKDDAACRYDISREMTFTNLDTNSAHLFCLMKKTSHATSPKNCIPFHFDDTKSIWGHDEIIIALVCSTVLSLVVGVLCGWLLSCWCKRVFKAKELLQYQTSERTTSKTVTEIEDFYSSQASEYLATKHCGDNAVNASRLRRTYSDNSIVSCNSYITAVNPSPFEVIQWKLRKNGNNSIVFQQRDYLDRLEYDCLPPPLPPHPSQRDIDKIYETIVEPVYMRAGKVDPQRPE